MHQSLAAAAALGAALLTPAAPVAAEEPICHVGYQTYGDALAFNSRIVITNISTVTLYSWTLSFPLPDGQELLSGWAADFTADGQNVVAHSLPYNSVVAPAESVSVGFRASGDVAGAAPTEFRVNDHLCSTG